MRVFVHACAVCGCVGTHAHRGYWVVVWIACLVMELETLFLFIPPPAVTVVSGVCSLNSGLRDTWRTVKSTNPPNYAECYSPEHTPDSYYGKQKLRGTFKKHTTFIGLSHLYIYFCTGKI